MFRDPCCSESADILVADLLPCKYANMIATTIAKALKLAPTPIPDLVPVEKPPLAGDEEGTSEEMEEEEVDEAIEDACG
jgi:hypothetical protein